MSTKIYYAWRLKVDKLNDFIDFIRPQIYNNAEEILVKLIGAVTKEGIEIQRIEHPYWNENRLKLEHVFSLIREVSSKSKRYPGIDVDFALNIWMFGVYFYIIPIGEFKEFDVPDYAEEYGYWNNTDQPDGITDHEWETRATTWEAINLGSGKSSHNARRLCHSIINMSARYGDFDFEYEMGKRLK